MGRAGRAVNAVPERAPLLRPARSSDMPDIAALLSDSGLPTEDIPGDGEGVVVAVRDDRIVGVAALEQTRDGALLRSVAVAPEHRGIGLARDLCEDRLAAAARAGVAKVYLLTTDAATYFARLGFQPVARAAVPDGIRATREYSELCPDSATVMTLDRGGMGPGRGM